LKLAVEIKEDLMPTRELISLLGKKRYGFNVGSSVGMGGENNAGDVLVIQGMFQYIEIARNKTMFGPLTNVGMPHPFGAPELTGVLDFQTMAAITNFQMMNASSVLSVDSVIHPASYKNRDLNPFKPLMTITLLHVHALAARKQHGDADYTRGMLRLIPKLIPYAIEQVAHATWASK
jgi:hypothetical protein